MYEFIERAKDYTALAAYGFEPRRETSEYLVISEDYELLIDGTHETVLALPMTNGDIHSFVRRSHEGKAHLKIFFKNYSASEAVVIPKVDFKLCENDNSIELRLDSPTNVVIIPKRALDSEDSFDYHALSISLIPKTETPNENNCCRIFAPGIHEIDFIELTSGKTLFIAEGAVVKALPPKYSEKPRVESDWMQKKVYRPFIDGYKLKNIRITGGGIFDTSALDWHARSMISLHDCENILIEGITLIGAGAWNLTLSMCKNAVVRDIAIFGHRENSDGIDIVSSENVSIERCLVRTGDDAVCVKAMQSPPVTGGKNIDVSDCIVWNDKVRCFGIACETTNDISDVRFRKSTVIRSTAKWTDCLGSLCIIVCDSGKVSDISFEDIYIVKESDCIINCQIRQDEWSSQKEAGYIQNIQLKNIIAPNSSLIRIWGYDAEHLIENIKISRLSGNSIRIEKNEFAKNVLFEL